MEGEDCAEVLELRVGTCEVSVMIRAVDPLADQGVDPSGRGDPAAIRSTVPDLRGVPLDRLGPPAPVTSADRSPGTTFNSAL